MSINNKINRDSTHNKWWNYIYPPFNKKSSCLNLATSKIAFRKSFLREIQVLKLTKIKL